MRLIVYILLFFILRHCEVQSAGSNRRSIRKSQVDEILRLAGVLGIDAKQPLEVAKLGNKYYPKPLFHQRSALPGGTSPARYCPFIKRQDGKIQSCLKPAKTDAKCQHEVRWKSVEIWQHECGRGASKGEIYNFQYDVCAPDGMEFVRREQSYVVLFSVCYNRESNQSMHTEHKIVSYSYDSTNIVQPESYIDILSKKFYVHGEETNMENIAQAYQDSMNQSESINSDDPNAGNTLIPQTLLPETDFDPKYARGANLTYVVVRPQYKRVSNYWNLLNEIIWQQYHKHQPQATILAGTAQNLVNDGVAEIINMHPNGWITVPFIWWKAVLTDNMFSIVLFYNVPTNYRQIENQCDDRERPEETEKFCRNINEGLRHSDSDTIQYECCELTSDIAESINLTHYKFSNPNTEENIPQMITDVLYHSSTEDDTNDSSV